MIHVTIFFQQKQFTLHKHDRIKYYSANKLFKLRNPILITYHRPRLYNSNTMEMMVGKSGGLRTIYALELL